MSSGMEVRGSQSRVHDGLLMSIKNRRKGVGKEFVLHKQANHQGWKLGASAAGLLGRELYLSSYWVRNWVGPPRPPPPLVHFPPGAEGGVQPTCLGCDQDPGKELWGQERLCAAAVLHAFFVATHWFLTNSFVCPWRLWLCCRTGDLASQWFHNLRHTRVVSVWSNSGK